MHVGNSALHAPERHQGRHVAASDRTALDEKGYSCLYIAVDGQLAGLVPYSDEIRAESRPVIQQLHAMGIKNTIMLTGDNGVVARAVCTNIGLTRAFRRHAAGRQG